MKLSRTKEYNFGWLVVFPLIDVVFLLIFFLLLSSNFILQPGIAVSAPASPFLLGAQQNQQIISITGGAVPAIYFRDQKLSLARLGPLLVNWDAPRQRNLAITGFLIASFAAHAACFYLFQIVYPPTVSLTPAPQRVNLINPNSEQGATLLRWVDAEDPALASTTRRPPGAKLHLLSDAQHVPSYFASEPNLKEAPPLTVDLRVPSAQSPGPVPAPRPARAKPIEAAPTKVTFSNELDRIGQPT